MRRFASIVIAERGFLDKCDAIMAFWNALTGSSPSLARIAEIVRGHHEKLDGSGYRDG